MDCQKELFALPDGHHYLNCAYMSPLLKRVEEAGIEGIRQKNRPWDVTPDSFFEDSQTLRTLFCRLIHAENPEKIAILPSVSYGLSTVAQNLPKKSGKNIIVAGDQFPSNIYPWRRFAEKTGCRIHTIEPPKPKPSRARLWNEQILNAIDRDTLLVAIGNVHWTDGTFFDLEKIGERAREVNAFFAIDGTQSIGALPFDQQQIKADAIIAAGYKCLMGPYSMALGYFGDRFLDGVPLEEGWLDRKGSENFSGLVNYVDDYQPGAIRFDVGERSNFVLVPMMIKAIEQLLEWKPANIQQYCRELIQPLVEELPERGYKIEEEKSRSNHLFGVYLPEEIRPHDLIQKLSSQNIHVSVRGSSLRVSPSVYNDEADIAALLNVLTSKP